MSSSADVVIALDCSTTAAKAIAFFLDGRIAAEGRRPLELQCPAVGRYEQRAEDWWVATVGALADLVQRLPPPARPCALGITNQRESFVCLDAEYEPLRPAILWLDGRAQREATRLGTAANQQINGKTASTAPSLFKLAWLAEHEPETLRRTALVADVHAYVCHRLVGRAVSSTATADSTGLLDLHTEDWSARLVTAAGLVRGQLPPLVRPGVEVGPLLPRVAARTGLPPGLPVIAGIGDGQSAGLGLGAIGPEAAYLNLGTSISLGRHVAGRPVYPGLRTLLTAFPDRTAVETLLPAGGLTLSWFRSMVVGASDPGLEAAAARVPRGARGLTFVPYLTGRESPTYRPDDRGAFLGLGTEHGAPELYRAIIEGLAEDQRRCIEHLERTTALPVTTVALTGGLARSPFIQQVFADALERPLAVGGRHEATARGAAMIAAWALTPAGTELADVVARMCPPNRDVTDSRRPASPALSLP